MFVARMKIVQDVKLFSQNSFILECRVMFNDLLVLYFYNSLRIRKVC